MRIYGRLQFFEYEELTEQIIQNVDDALAGFKDKKHLQECIEDAMQMAGEECGYCAKNSDS